MSTDVFNRYSLTIKDLFLNFFFIFISYGGSEAHLTSIPCAMTIAITSGPHDHFKGSRGNVGLCQILLDWDKVRVVS